MKNEPAAEHVQRLPMLKTTLGWQHVCLMAANLIEEYRVTGKPFSGSSNKQVQRCKDQEVQLKSRNKIIAGKRDK